MVDVLEFLIEFVQVPDKCSNLGEDDVPYVTREASVASLGRNSIDLLKDGESNDNPWEHKCCKFCRVKLCFGHDYVVPCGSCRLTWSDKETE